MKTKELFIAVILIVLSYVVLHFELWDKKWRVIIPMYIRKHVYLRLMRPIHPSQSVTWRSPSNRLVSTSDKIVSDIPNIVFIITDDLGLNDLSGGSGVLTPNIDSIRHNGLAFSQAYAGQATCAPSRGAMLTGRYPTRFGYEFTPGPKGLARILTVPTEGEIFQPILHKHLIDKLPPVEEMSLSRNETLISEVLQQYGYDTYYMGKWDSGPAAPHTPIDRGYNESLSFAVGASLYHKDGHPDLINGYGDKFDDFLRLVCRFYVSHNNGAKFEPDKYMTDYLSEQASNLIRSRTSTSTAGSTRVDPFFLTLAYNAPHNPYQAMRSDYEDPEVQKLPTHFQRVYAAMIKALDRGVGQVLQALRDSGQYENTLVIFTNDNGGAHYANLPHINAPYRGWKATFFEGGIRMPLFMQWPARIQPERHGSVAENEEICRTYASRSAHLGVPCSYRVIDDVVSHVDLFTSLVSLVHPVPQETAARPLDGLNLFDLIKLRGGWLSQPTTTTPDTTAHTTTADEKTEHMTDNTLISSMEEDVAKHSRDRALFWRSGHYCAMRVGDYKMHIALRPDKVWFFNLLDDPTEQRNLASELGVTNRTALKSLYNTYLQDPTVIRSVSEDDGRVKTLLEVYAIFEKVEAEQEAPSWPAASETPVTIDKVIGAQQEESDEFIYWSN